ncbi:Dehydrogenase azaJ [Fusarium oxysporum f. sp. albedinis]|nr:Dehydrogenase azaJ [Fusarium oxysporum f. sp. albedinis]
MVFKRRNTSVLCNKMAETRVIHPREPLAEDKGKQAKIRVMKCNMTQRSTRNTRHKLPADNHNLKQHEK